jgi:hypothetical protein
MSSTRLLYLSLAANGLLLGAVLVFWSKRAEPAVQAPASAPLVESPKPLLSSALPATTAPDPSPRPPLAWSDLESADYPTYIRNLRGIGCPEETIRDIITADVAALYLIRRQELSADRQLTEVADEALRREQAALLATLLDPAPVANSAARQQLATPAPAGGSKAAARKKDAPIVLPVVMAEPAPSLGLTEQQKERLVNLRQEFIASLGGPDQNPEDPAYLSRWVAAQPKFDEQFKTLFGAKAFAEQQAIAARLTAQEEAQNAGANPASTTNRQPRFDRQIRLESGVHVFR